MTPEFINLLSLLNSDDVANQKLAFQLYKHHKKEFKKYFGYGLRIYKSINKYFNKSKQPIYLEDFANKICDKLYDYNLDEENQSSGWKTLKKMVLEKIEPATLEEIERYENNPTKEELFSIPDIKYMRVFHVKMRSFLIKHWEVIKYFKTY